MLAFRVLFLVFFASILRAQTKPDVPFIQVRTEAQVTAVTTPKPSRSKLPKGAKVTVQAVIVRVELKSFSPPKQPYDVQCFVIVQSELDGSQYISDAQRRSSSALNDTLLFQGDSAPGYKTWTLLPRGRITTAGQTIRVLPTTVESKRLKGTKYYGWVVRVISAGVAVRHESNQPDLKTVAETTPAPFDLALTNTED